jgi:hypothetical protein
VAQGCASLLCRQGKAVATPGMGERRTRRWRRCGRCGREPAGEPAREPAGVAAHAPLLGTAETVRPEQRGCRCRPARSAVEQPERHHGSDLLARPVHPRALHARLHDRCVRTLRRTAPHRTAPRRTAPHRPAVRTNDRSGELSLAFTHSGHVLAQSRRVALPAGEDRQHPAWALPPEPVAQARARPSTAARRLPPVDGAACLHQRAARRSG